MDLSALGERICILGPSNSGKSTLASAIARKLQLPAVHLDVLFHVPRTDWQPRPYAEFERLHGIAVAGPQWVMDGNYTQMLPQRLARATGFILLDVSTPVSLYRYLRRSWFQQNRVGALEGGRDSVKWDMLHHIAVTTPKNRKRYAELLRTIPVPAVYLRSARQVSACYAAWRLVR